MPINQEGHAFTRAKKRHAEGVTALPKARLSALAVVCSLQSGPKKTLSGLKHNPALDTTPPSKRAKLKENCSHLHRSPDLRHFLRRLCALFDGEGDTPPTGEAIG